MDKYYVLEIWVCQLKDVYMNMEIYSFNLMLLHQNKLQNNKRNN